MLRINSKDREKMEDVMQVTERFVEFPSKIK